MTIKRNETDKEIHDRILKLCKNNNKMDAQTALNELCDHLLGKDWYVVDPLPNCQVNPIIVEEIEQKYRNKVKIKLKFVIDK
jgi:hypothetical protein